MQQPKFQIKDFYFMAFILMLVVVGANLWNLVVNWATMNLPGRISFIAGSVLFQFLLFGLFLWLWKTTPKITQIVNDKILDEVLAGVETKLKNKREVK